jgi:hypothetical protein
MTLKWDKKTCIEHITQLKSPLENKTNGQGNLSTLAQKLRRALGKGQGKIPQEVTGE